MAKLNFPLGVLINSDRARALKRPKRADLNVMDDDLDAYVASWEDFHRGGTGRWYDPMRRDIYDLDEYLEPEEDPDAKKDAHADMEAEGDRPLEQP